MWLKTIIIVRGLVELLISYGHQKTTTSHHVWKEKLRQLKQGDRTLKMGRGKRGFSI
jgi:hypothetical protein